MTTGISSAALVFGKNLGCKLAIKDFVVTKKCHSLAYIELLLRVVNILAASNDAFAESGPLPWLVSYPGWKRQSSSTWMALSATNIVTLLQ